MLADIELPLVQEINTLEKRVLAEHKPPGMDGSLLQNLGRRPFRLALWGVATGEGASGLIEELEDKYRAGLPLPFTADIVADARLEQVVIQDLRVQELAGKPERFSYVLTLREYLEPVEPEDPSLIEPDILEDALDLMDDLDVALELCLDFVTGLEQFVPILTEFLKRLQEFRTALSTT